MFAKPWFAKTHLNNTLGNMITLTMIQATKEAETTLCYYIATLLKSQFRMGVPLPISYSIFCFKNTFRRTARE